jgi:hypothetical protein
MNLTDDELMISIDSNYSGLPEGVINNMDRFENKKYLI